MSARLPATSLKAEAYPGFAIAADCFADFEDPEFGVNVSVPVTLAFFTRLGGETDALLEAGSGSG